MSEIIQHHSCGIIVYRYESKLNQNLFLLLKYPQGHIDLAKGHIEPGEQLVDCAKRELLEETGIADIKLVDGFTDVISYTYSENDQTHYKKVDFFLGETQVQEIKISHEHTDFMWLPFEQALENLTFDNARTLLTSAKSFLDTVSE
tara:strand:+ start:138 stop:575 length:438 start_codon:yes stop_codon:yes gene_type:complete